jgi:transposase
MERKAYPRDVTDDEWAFVAPDLTLMTEEAPQRDHSLREVSSMAYAELCALERPGE